MANINGANIAVYENVSVRNSMELNFIRNSYMFLKDLIDFMK